MTGVQTCALPIFGFIGEAFRRQLAAFYLLAYVGLLTLWPSTIPQPRYLMPITPFLVLCFFDGFLTALRIIRRWTSKLQPYGASLQKGIFLTIVWIMMTMSLLKLYEVRRDLHDFRAEWKSYFEAVEWIGKQAPPEAIVVARKPFLAHLVSRRKTVGFPFSPESSVVLEHITRYRATFVVVDSLRGETSRYLTPAIGAHWERFEWVYSTPTFPSTYVYRVREWTDATGPKGRPYGP